MTIDDFRRLALSLEGAEEGSHMGSPDFRVGNRIFATLASADQGYGNIKLTPEQQDDFVRELPKIFIPVKGGWGKAGFTHINLEKASEEIVAGALKVAWMVRSDLNTKSKSPSTRKSKRVKPIRKKRISARSEEGA